MQEKGEIFLICPGSFKVHLLSRMSMRQITAQGATRLAAEHYLGHQ
jgi:hypothetical protein